MNLEEIKLKIIPILKKYNVKKAGIFGSYARGEQRETSDIDILVDIDDDLSLLDFASLKVELEGALGKKVDLVEYTTIKSKLRKEILKDEVVVF
jgi:predicted nucleotidyltransferase